MVEHGAVDPILDMPLLNPLAACLAVETGTQVGSLHTALIWLIVRWSVKGREYQDVPPVFILYVPGRYHLASDGNSFGCQFGFGEVA